MPVSRLPVLRIGIVGSGPAGFYTAHKLLHLVPNAVIDMYEALPVPFGLVRYGVAPDHAEVKVKKPHIIGRVLKSVLELFNYIGNIQVGRDIQLLEMKEAYHGLVLAYGASKSNKLGIEGENTLQGVYSAQSFVGWYNGLPEFSNLEPNLACGEVATIIGQGNVALDIARILLCSLDKLRTTDMPEYALHLLQQSKIRKVKIVGRRSLLQAAFTVKELRELTRLPDVSFESAGVLSSVGETKDLTRTQRRIVELITRLGSNHRMTKSWFLEFLRSPHKLLAKTADSTSIGFVEYEENSLQSDGRGNVVAMGTGRFVTEPTDLLFKSIGYRSEPLEGCQELSLPFDAKHGIIPNVAGKVINPESRDFVPGVYVSGWVKRGPTGVIASTMQDAFETAERIALDWTGQDLFFHSKEKSCSGWDELKDVAVRRGLFPVSWQGWKKIDVFEVQRGLGLGKEREKVVNVQEMLNILCDSRCYLRFRSCSTSSAIASALVNPGDSMPRRLTMPGWGFSMTKSRNVPGGPSLGRIPAKSGCNSADLILGKYREIAIRASAT